METSDINPYLTGSIESGYDTTKLHFLVMMSSIDPDMVTKVVLSLIITFLLGVIMVKRVRDAEGDKKEEIVEPVKTSRKDDTSTEEEPEPPEPFEYTE